MSEKHFQYCGVKGWDSACHYERGHRGDHSFVAGLSSEVIKDQQLQQGILNGQLDIIRFTLEDPTRKLLWVGISQDGSEVVINHPQLQHDEKGIGYLTFSPEQARNLARLLIEKADEVEREKTP